MNYTIIFACNVAHSPSAFPTFVEAAFCSSPSPNHSWQSGDSAKLCTCNSKAIATFIWPVMGRSGSSSLYMEDTKLYATREHETSFQIHTTRIHSTDTGMLTGMITGLNYSRKVALKVWAHSSGCWGLDSDLAAAKSRFSFMSPFFSGSSVALWVIVLLNYPASTEFHWTCRHSHIILKILLDRHGNSSSQWLQAWSCSKAGPNHLPVTMLTAWMMFSWFVGLFLSVLKTFCQYFWRVWMCSFLQICSYVPFKLPYVSSSLLCGVLL